MEEFGWRPGRSQRDPWEYEQDLTLAFEWLATLLATIAEAAGARLASLDGSPRGCSASILDLGLDQRWRGGQRSEALKRPA
jgi:hypothetical protein